MPVMVWPLPPSDGGRMSMAVCVRMLNRARPFLFHDRIRWYLAEQGGAQFSGSACTRVPLRAQLASLGMAASYAHWLAGRGRG